MTFWCSRVPKSATLFSSESGVLPLLGVHQPLSILPFSVLPRLGVLLLSVLPPLGILFLLPYSLSTPGFSTTSDSLLYRILYYFRFSIIKGEKKN